MGEKDKVFELEISGPNDISGKVRLENSNNRVLAKIGDVFIDKLNWYRWNNAVKFMDKYETIKEKRGFNGKETPLPPKYLVEILDSGFIEDEDILQETWAKILANWQDPNKKLDRRPIYLEIIKSLTASEVKILDLISKISNINDYLVGKTQGINSNYISSSLGISKEDYQLCMLNLFRCGCFESFKVKNKSISMGGINPVKDFGIDAVSLTVLGLNLINNVKE